MVNIVQQDLDFFCLFVFRKSSIFTAYSRENFTKAILQKTSVIWQETRIKYTARQSVFPC